MSRAIALHIGLIALLFALQFSLPAYHHGNLARIMVLAVYAIGYNIMFAYTGLLSLGHAMFFVAGRHGMGLATRQWGIPIGSALLIGVAAGVLFSLIVGFLALRTKGVAFMIVTLLFSQATYLTILFFSDITRGDEGFVIQQATRQIAGIDLSDPANRYLAALLLFSIALFTTLALVRSPAGRVLVAIRENEDRATMLGYDVWRHKLLAVVMSGTIAARAAYGALFGFVSARFAEVPSRSWPCSTCCSAAPAPSSARWLALCSNSTCATSPAPSPTRICWTPASCWSSSPSTPGAES